MASFLFRLIVQDFLPALLAWSVEFAIDEIGLGEIGQAHGYSMAIPVIKPAVILAAGLVLGAAAYARWERDIESALWVWAGPVGLLAFALALDTRAFGWHNIIDQYFVWMRPGVDEPPIGRFIFVFPAISALAYSLGALISKRGGGYLLFTKNPSMKKLGEL